MSARRDHSYDKTALRFAKQVYLFACEYRSPTYSSAYEASMLQSISARASALERQLQAANSRGFSHLSTAPECFKKNLEFQLSRLENLTSTVHSAINRLITPPKQAVASLRSIHADILKLREDFPDVKINLQQKAITVTTETITLYDKYDNCVDFGPFEVTLDFRSHTKVEFHWIVTSTNPHQSAEDSGLSHPHVRAGRLCAGEAFFPLHHCMRTGHIYEFFQVFKTTLETWSDETCYANLASWLLDGRCADCNAALDTEESLRCEHCDNYLCDDCVYHCSDCDTVVCPDCRDYCYECEKMFCSGCIYSCEDCKRHICEDCRTLCESCEAIICPRCTNCCPECECIYCSQHSCECSEEKTEKEEDTGQTTLRLNESGTCFTA